MKKYFSRVRCKGTEKRLEDCQWEDHEMSIQCTSSDSVAGVICASGTSRAPLLSHKRGFLRVSNPYNVMEAGCIEKMILTFFSSSA